MFSVLTRLSQHLIGPQVIIVDDAQAEHALAEQANAQVRKMPEVLYVAKEYAVSASATS